MQNDRPSTSALISAFVRGYHSTHANPKIFDDYLALQFLTAQERAMFESNLSASLSFFDPAQAALAPDQAAALAGFMRAQSSPIVLSRARFVEDKLAHAIANGITQYVILGAGLDTFAFRRPELLEHLRVFELDHPATQTWKRNRIEQLGWKIPPQLAFIPLDFNTGDLSAALVAAGYDQHQPALFSWLGVTYYLPRAVVLGTIQTISKITLVGSAILFDYLDADAFIPERTATRVQRMQEATRRAGEPIQTGFDPASLAQSVSQFNFCVTEDLAPSEIDAKYFQHRTDNYHAFEHIHLVSLERCDAKI